MTRVTFLLWGPPSESIEEILFGHCYGTAEEPTPVVNWRACPIAWGRRDCVRVTFRSEEVAEAIANICGAERVRLVRVDTLRKGDRFCAFDGSEYVFDHEKNGCCWVRGSATECFAGCANVEALSG